MTYLLQVYWDPEDNYFRTPDGHILCPLDAEEVLALANERTEL